MNGDIVFTFGILLIALAVLGYIADRAVFLDRWDPYAEPREPDTLRDGRR